jgi:lipoate-protein ligase B
MMNWTYLGVVPYTQALTLQHQLVEQHKQGDGVDTLLLLQHPPVITLGRRADERNILASSETLASEGIEVHRVERGGDVTYHGLGQLVGYPILNLRHFKLDVTWYVESLAEVMVRTLADFGVRGTYQRDLVGVWVGDEKIVALGMSFKSWISFHGFALNIATPMRHWELIVPCGIHAKGMTSLAKLLGRDVAVMEAVPLVVKHFGEVFGVELEQREP